MPRIRDAELFGVTETSATISFVVADAAGRPCDAPARVRVGDVRRVCEGGAATRLVRVEGLAPGTAHELELKAGGEAAAPDAFLPARVETLPAPRAACVARFATLNDLHFGEARFGGTVLEDGGYGDPAPGFPVVRETDGDAPYWQVMNDDAVEAINDLGVDCTVIKGDIADRGRPEQFAIAARTFARLSAPWHAFLGNHDYYALADEGREVDGYAALGQPAAPRALDLGGWRLLLIDTVEPGEHHGVFPDARLRWLADALDETRELGTPTLVLTHHQPVPPQFADRFPNTIGIVPEHSLRLFDLLGRNPQVRAVLIGHTHRNRVRRHPASGRVPFVEVHCVKDYPGGFAHYRLFDDGHFRQEVRRTPSARALAHSTRCRDFFNGGYRSFALGPLRDRCFIEGGR